MNNTIQRVLELESKFALYDDCEIVVTIKSPLKEMRDAANYLSNTYSPLSDGTKLNIHIFAPFETPEVDYYYFRFKSEQNKGLTIEVRSEEIFRLKREITEI